MWRNKMLYYGKSRDPIKQIRAYISTYDIYIDTCSLMNRNAELVFSELKELLKYNKRKIKIIHNVKDELKKLKKDFRCCEQAENGLKIIREMEKGKVAVTVKSPVADKLADAAFLTIFDRDRLSENLLLITQDNTLTTDILNKNFQKSAIGKKIIVMKINSDGELETSRVTRKNNEYKSKPIVSTVTHIHHYHYDNDMRYNHNTHYNNNVRYDDNNTRCNNKVRYDYNNNSHYNNNAHYDYNNNTRYNNYAHHDNYVQPSNNTYLNKNNSCKLCGRAGKLIPKSYNRAYCAYCHGTYYV